MEYKITIVTATFNAGGTVEQCISSIKEQVYENIEYIIIDGGSSDNTLDIIRKYENVIHYWISEADDGVYDAFNKAIKVATGDYILFIGADDALSDEYAIKHMVENLSDDVDALGTSVYKVEESTLLEEMTDGYIVEDRENYHGGMVCHQGLMVKCSLAKRLLFDQKYKIASDYKMFLQLYLNPDVRFKFINIPLSYFCLSGMSGTKENVEKLRHEKSEIEKEFGLDFAYATVDKWSAVRKRVKCVLNVLGVFEKMRYVYLRYIRGMKPHQCNNKICRWCKRI